MANNILNEGKETLKKIYEEVKDLGQNELREKELMAAEDNTEKALADKEKAVAKEKEKPEKGKIQRWQGFRKDKY